MQILKGLTNVTDKIVQNIVGVKSKMKNFWHHEAKEVKKVIATK